MPFVAVCLSLCPQTDKLYTKWKKTGSIGGKAFTNPVVNNTGDDPSTAWRLNGDETAEWR
eukprot:SAG22_NODE_3543_length_1651_cov_1.594716_3_plen_59_part_01